MQLTIRGRLFSLVGLMLVLMMVLGVSGRLALSSAGTGLNNVVVASESLRNHSEGDMTHDALRADVLAALLADSAADHNDAAASLAEHAGHFREMIDANNKIASADTKQALAD